MDNINLTSDDYIMKENYLNDLFIKSFRDAAASLSQLTNKEMKIYSSNIELLSGEDFINGIEGQLEDRYFASLIKVIQGINASIIFLTPEEEGCRLYDMIINNKVGTTTKVNEDVISAIGEVNNIIGSVFSNNVANFINREINPTTPSNNFDMLGALLQGIILQEELIGKKILYADTVIKENDVQEFHSRLLMLVDKNELMKLMIEQKI